jgi:predicted esterase
MDRAIATGTHGRYLIEPPVSAGPAAVLVGFHGYSEGAEAQLERMRRVPGADRWLLVSIQALNRFYQRRTNDVVASWMTRQDRELAIADNLAYVNAVIAAVDGEYGAGMPLVLSGFSQGVSMAFRAAAGLSRRVDGVIAVGGDVPPELGPDTLEGVSGALVCHGTGDEFYTRVIFERDLQRLRNAGVTVRALEFEGGHEWSDTVVEAASLFLRERWR